MLDPYPRMLRVGAAIGAVLAVVSVPLAAILRGPVAAFTALGSLVVIVGAFLVTGASLRWAGRRGPTTLQAVALGGLLVRLALYALLLATLVPLGIVDKPTLAVVAPLAIIVVLVAEVRLVLANPEFRMLHARPAWAHDGPREWAPTEKDRV